MLLGVGMILWGIFCSLGVSALEYQSQVDVEFVFSDALNISLSAADLIIRDLAPGSADYSNTITVSVSTNSVIGYTLSAKVGNGTTYTNDRLTSSAGTYFTNRSSSATLTNFSPNEWGYTISDPITSSTTYSGLVYNTDTLINATVDAAGTAAVGYNGGTDTSFTIGAKADSTQTAGIYRNIIIFTAVSNPITTTYSVTYNRNTSDNVFGMPNNLSNIYTADASMTLSTTTPDRSGFNFIGWCTTATADNASCSGTSYGAGGTVPITTGQANTITLYAMWRRDGLIAATDCPASSICYAPGVPGVEGSMSSLGTTTELSHASAKAGKVTVTANSTARLIAPNYKREGYGFAGWSTDADATDASTIYGPNETISTGSLSPNGLVLYPVWVASAGNFQTWTGCPDMTAASYNSSNGELSLSLSSITALTDVRDGNVYAVAKLADGECWMIENLRLNAEDTRGAEKENDSQGYGSTYGGFIGLADSEDENFTGGTSTDTANNPTPANSIYYAGTQSGTASINIIQSQYAALRMPRYNNNNTNIGGKNSSGVDLEPSYNGNTNTAQWYGYGNYYTWAAAMANTAYFSGYSGASGSDSADTSICPAYWHLPLGVKSNGVLADGESDSNNRVGSFSYLDRKMGGTGDDASTNAFTNATMALYWTKFPNNFVYSGSWGSSTAPTNRNTNGYYWSKSATGNSSVYAHHLSFSTSAVNPGAGRYYRYRGYAVRCVSDGASCIGEECE